MRMGIDARSTLPARPPAESPGLARPRRMPVTAPASTDWAVFLICAALVLCLGTAIAWFQNVRVELEERTEGDILAQRRSVRFIDLDFGRLHREYDARFRVPIRFRLVNNRDGTFVRVVGPKDERLAERRLRLSDLEQQRILNLYRARTGESANSVTLYFRKKRAMLLVQQID